MSGIYIPGMELPRVGYEDIRIFADGSITATSHKPPYYRSDYRAVPVPDHGRLIDGDADPNEYVTVWDCDCSEFGRQTVMAVDDLAYLPTIIPASGGKENE